MAKMGKLRDGLSEKHDLEKKAAEGVTVQLLKAQKEQRSEYTIIQRAFLRN